MALPGGEEWIRRWVAADQPTATQLRFLRRWIESLQDDPRPSQSAQAAWPQPHGQDELRTAYLMDADAFVVYAVNAGGQARVLHIGFQPPDGIAFGLP